MKRHLRLFGLGVLAVMTIPIYITAQPAARQKATGGSLAAIINRYVGKPYFERISYDEKKEILTDLPKDFNISTMSGLDVPYAANFEAIQHVDEVLTLDGKVAKVITYISEKNPGDTWQNQAVYRVLTAEKVIALDAAYNVITETTFDKDYTVRHTTKALDAMRNGLFQIQTFKEPGIAEIAGFETNGYKLKMEEDEYQFLKGDVGFFYNPVGLYYGKAAMEGDKLVKRFSFFTQHEDGYLIPRNTHVYYADKLPTGVAVHKSEFVIVSNFKLEGERYTKLAKGEGNGMNLIRVAPNPAKDLMKVEVSFSKRDNVEKMSYLIVDATGRTIAAKQGLAENRVFEVNTSALPAGVYLVQVQCGNQKLQTKFIKN